MELFDLERLNRRIIDCTRCPRLTAYRKVAPVRAEFKGQSYWRRPLSGFGDSAARVLFVGLAPAAQGGNRTGRVLTGDETGAFLMRCLYRTGFANQPYSRSIDDGLVLTGCYLTAAVKCVPPQNRPLPIEFEACSSYLENEIFLLKDLRIIVALGQGAYKACSGFLKKASKSSEKMAPFGHGVSFQLPGWPRLYGSYHPSPRNTYTGKLTESMMIALLKEVKSASLHL